MGAAGRRRAARGPSCAPTTWSRRGGELLVAEVKTGEAAPSLATAATRRQLLEYHVAFAADGVLLVCPERGAIHRIEFPLAARDAVHLSGCTDADADAGP